MNENSVRQDSPTQPVLFVSHVMPMNSSESRSIMSEYAEGPSYTSSVPSHVFPQLLLRFTLMLILFVGWAALEK